MSTITIHMKPIRQAARQAEQPVLEKPQYRISTKNLERLDRFFNLAGGAVSYSINPGHTIVGALAGSTICLLIGDMAHKDENRVRTSHIASLCMTVLSATYFFASPGPHTFVPLIFGMGGADAAYQFLRKFVE